MNILNNQYIDNDIWNIVHCLFMINLSNEIQNYKYKETFDDKINYVLNERKINIRIQTNIFNNYLYEKYAFN